MILIFQGVSYIEFSQCSHGHFQFRGKQLYIRNSSVFYFFSEWAGGTTKKGWHDRFLDQDVQVQSLKL